MTLMKNKHVAGISIIFATILLVSSLLTFSASAFNNKEIELLTTKCYETNGEVELILHNPLTHSYSFSCNKN
ncbi:MULTISPECIES: hypothetical protein [Bacillus]|uniref:Uncharacterized protein n=2 Tax=Bacillus TaxID=1386 RepID=A0A0M3RA84_9BACI|nr:MULTISPECIES: hypothetical protein [Bacillus]ALC82742.1 hypothetical protein AM592_14990 [Bacillus gobiensis]MBP1081695.1 hypothetical protein [Bacillus capparidis]MED1096348.1 hypothetical protein [Bacillus capparidis]